MKKDEIEDLDFFDRKREGFIGSSGLSIRLEMEKLLGYIRLLNDEIKELRHTIEVLEEAHWKHPS
tara:strand:- start:773 stop:967 length:195 start_codon:yes stop_codon:yes gene_type:complete